MTDIEDKNMQRIVRGGDTADSQPLIWDSDENMVALRLRITNMVASQRANNLIQTTSIHGNVDTKLVNAMLMGTAGFMLGQTCMEFAIGAGNLVLEGEMKISQEELIKSGSASVIKARNQLVNDRCTSNLAAMITAGFQITAGKIATHLGYIGNYNTSIPSWKDADVIKKEATANIKIGNSTTVNSIIPSAKRLLLPYKVSNSVWYGTMINALKPLTTGTRLEAIIIKFEDATTETAIKGVVLHINENNKNYISTKLGYSRAKSLGTGNYSATWSHPLYGSGRIPVMGYTHTDTLHLGGMNLEAAYFVDDICVSTDSLLCFEPIGIPVIADNPLVSIFPNPVIDDLNIEMKTGSVWNIFIYSCMGQIIYTSCMNIQNAVIDFKKYAAGIYLIVVNQNNKTFSQKIIKF